MSHAHGSHAHSSPTPSGKARPRSDWSRTHRRLLAVLVPLLVAAVAGVVWFWPGGDPDVTGEPRLDVSEDREAGVVRSTVADICPGAPTDRRPDGTIPESALCATAVVEIVTGVDDGAVVSVPVPPQVYRSGIDEGTRLTLARYPVDDLGAGAGLDGSAGSDALDTADAAAPDVAPSGNVYAWVDFSREQPLIILAIVFAVLVVAVARLRGVAALAGLALGYVTIIEFMLPAVRAGEDPVGVALSGSVVIMTVILYLAHGFSARTTTALLGTIFGLGVIAALAWWASNAAHLNGLTGEDTYTVSALTGGGDLSGIILCGTIVAGLGVLNDVTITQASAVWEVHDHSPRLGLRGLFGSGMRVGRDHLASTVYTIAFAYAGAALPTFLLIDLYSRPLGQVLTSGEIVEEVARTLVAAIGLIVAIPLTTGIAALAVTGSRHGATLGPEDERVDKAPAMPR